jgi:hypothetical protein
MARDRKPVIISIKYAASFFSKRQLAATVMMIDEEKNVSLSDKKKSLWVHKCSRSIN